IFPKFRADLLESAVVARLMREGAIEETVILRNPLDVLAQQIVAISSQEEITVDDLHELLARAYPFRQLSGIHLENVLDMPAGRPYELGESIGRATRELVALSDAKAGDRLRTEYALDERAATNLLAFLREQEGATGAVPSDRTVVVERFRDEIGDWRVCILTPFGGRVHAPWALALAGRLRELLGLEVQSIWSDDGIAVHLPDADAPPPIDDIVDRKSVV